METVITATTNNPLVARHIASVTVNKGSAYVGIAKSLLIEEAKRQMRSGTCHFGTVREAFGTLNASLCGKHINGRGQSPENWGCSCYFDIERGAFRSFRWANIIDVLS